MKLSRTYFRIVMGGLALATVLACGKKEDEEEAGKGKSLSDVEGIDELNISSSLKVKVPDALSGAESSSLRLAAKKRSFEACRMGQTIKEVTRSIEDIGSFFCHLEVEKDKIKFGTKYKIKSNGKEFGRVWADNSVEGKINLYMCQDGKLKEKISVTGVDPANKASKGTIQQRGEQDTQSWKRSVVFDKEYTDPNITTVESEDKFEDSGEQGGSFARRVALKLYSGSGAKQTGVSNLVLASQGTWGGAAFKDRGIARYDGEYGEALMYGKGTFGESDFEYTQKSYFDGDGYVVADDESKDFAKGGDLYVGDEDLPEYLKTSFEPSKPTGWDCDVDETIELNPDSKAHEACDNKDDYEEASCWDSDEFEQGEAVE